MTWSATSWRCSTGWAIGISCRRRCAWRGTGAIDDAVRDWHARLLVDPEAGARQCRSRRCAGRGRPEERGGVTSLPASASARGLLRQWRREQTLRRARLDRILAAAATATIISEFRRRASEKAGPGTVVRGGDRVSARIALSDIDVISRIAPVLRRLRWPGSRRTRSVGHSSGTPALRRPA